MAQMHDLYIKLDVLETLVKTIKAKSEKGIAITIATSDDTNQYGQNVSSWVSQKQDERDKPKYYVGNGKVFWNNGVVKNAERKEQGQQSYNPQEPTIADEDLLPF